MVHLEFFGKEDFKQLIDWVNSEYLITNWSGSLFKYPLSEDSLEWYIKDTNNFEDSDAFVYKAVNSKTRETVGHISLGGISQKNRSARISRVLVGNTGERGKGYCGGMIKAILKIGFDEMELHRITLGVFDFNKSAIRCYEKNGFKKEGLMRDVLQYKPDEYWSMVEMSILENEWREMQEKKSPHHAAGRNILK